MEGEDLFRVQGFFFFFLSKVLDQFPVQDLCDFQILVI